MDSQRGSVALLGLIMMILLGSMGVTLLMLSQTDLQIALNHRDGIGAQYLAEAGIQYAVAKLKTDDKFVSQTAMNQHTITSDLCGMISTVGSYTVRIGPESQVANPKTRLIIATGIVNKAQRQVVAHITLPITSNLNSTMIIWTN